MSGKLLTTFKKRLPALSLLGVILSGIMFFILAVLLKAGHVPMWDCAFNRFTGLNCPSCGMTRSIESLMSLRLAESLALNPSPILILIFYFTLLIHRVRDVYRNTFTRFKYLPVWICAIVIIAAIYALLRNIGIFPII
ncbi:MAG: DUF2752 domain-containing protein [Ruminococcaceae bacterium]|nr:DUF2752 domain-containing protein [Oscillospiraceae bacterium]